MKCNRLVSVVLAAAFLVIAETSTADSDETTTPHFEKFSQSYQLPFTHPLDFNNLKGMHVRVSLNGGPPHDFQVDTGSVGIVVGADDVPNIDPKAPAGSLTYSSSGREF